MSRTDKDGSTDMCERLATFLDDERFARLALARRDEFRSAEPFPHAVIDDFLPPDIATAVPNGYPGSEQLLGEMENPCQCQRA